MRYVKSPYFQSRHGYNPEFIVIHTCVGYYESTISYFENNDRNVSAHYVVKEDGGEICQMVDEINSAHHAGIVSNPDPRYYKEGVNPNFYTIGIENADNKQPQDWDRTGQYKTLAILVREICHRWNIPIDRNHICGHRELYDRKTCPGNLDVDKIVKLAKEGDFIMDDDTKKAFEQLQLSQKEFGYGNLESTVRGMTGAQRDIVTVKNELLEYKNGEPIRIKTAVDTALSDNNLNWQKQIDSANSKIADLEKKIDTLITTQAENLPYSVLFSIAWKKFWKIKKGGDK